MTNEVALLPEAFADLEPFARIWVLPTATERYRRRIQSSMSEMQAFYDAVVARGDAIFAYLDQFAFEDLPESAVNLMWMMCSLSAVSFAIDIFKQPRVIDAGDGDLPWLLEPVP